MHRERVWKGDTQVGGINTQLVEEAIGKVRAPGRGQTRPGWSLGWASELHLHPNYVPEKHRESLLLEVPHGTGRN